MGDTFTELPDWGFIQPLNPSRNPDIAIAREYCERAMASMFFDADFANAIGIVAHRIELWTNSHFSEATSLKAGGQQRPDAANDFDRIKMLVHTAGTLISQAEVIMQYESLNSVPPERGLYYARQVAEELALLALYNARVAQFSARVSRKEMIT